MKNKYVIRFRNRRKVLRSLWNEYLVIDKRKQNNDNRKEIDRLIKAGHRIDNYNPNDPNNFSHLRQKARLIAYQIHRIKRGEDPTYVLLTRPEAAPGDFIAVTLRMARHAMYIQVANFIIVICLWMGHFVFGLNPIYALLTAVIGYFIGPIYKRTFWRLYF